MDNLLSYMIYLNNNLNAITPNNTGNKNVNVNVKPSRKKSDINVEFILFQPFQNYN